MMNGELKCFDHNLYAALADIGSPANPYQCIAPTKKGLRCRWQINEDDFKQAEKFRNELETLPDSPERNDAIARFTLYNCCNKWHREKLESDLDCLRELVARFGKDMPMAEQVIELVQETTKQASPEPSLLSMVVPHDSSDERFVMYATDPDDTVRNALSSSIHWKSPKFGEVYGFTRSLSSQYVKIGYTSKTAEARVADQEACNPGAQVRFYSTFAYPERLERLVHLQMAKWRRKIIRCRNCRRTHYEWFEVSVDHASGVVNDWARLVAREPLYDSNRTLRAPWLQRIEKVKGDVTAKKLLAVLDAELLQQQQQLRSLAAERRSLGHWHDPSIRLGQSVPRLIPTPSLVESENMLAFFRDFMLLLISNIPLTESGKDRLLLTALATKPPVLTV